VAAVDAVLPVAAALQDQHIYKRLLMKYHCRRTVLVHSNAPINLLQFSMSALISAVFADSPAVLFFCNIHHKLEFYHYNYQARLRSVHQPPCREYLGLPPPSAALEPCPCDPAWMPS
jgi:hypothetical protein